MAGSTNRYNSSDHPIPFHKAQDLGKVPKKLAADSVPDLEEAFDVSLSPLSLDDVDPIHLLSQLDEAVDEVSDEDEKSARNADDVGNDKLIKAPKKKAAVKSTKAKK
jgi:replication factor C subunit 1